MVRCVVLVRHKSGDRSLWIAHEANHEDKRAIVGPIVNGAHVRAEPTTSSAAKVKVSEASPFVVLSKGMTVESLAATLTSRVLRRRRLLRP